MVTEQYLNAAEQDDSKTQNQLGYLFENGIGVTQDMGKAVRWYQKAANHGFEPAMDNLTRLKELLGEEAVWSMMV